MGSSNVSARSNYDKSWCAGVVVAASSEKQGVLPVAGSTADFLANWVALATPSVLLELPVHSGTIQHVFRMAVGR